MTFEEYVRALYQDIPINFVIGLLLALCIGVAVIIGYYGWKRGWRKIAGLLLVEYIFLLFCSTVVFRATADARKYEWEPFWSYKAIEEGKTELLPENIMNVVVFVPVGILLGSLFFEERSGRAERMVKGSWWKAILIGCVISVSIETLQFFFHRGFAETDDVMHNTFGCILGYGVFLMIQGLWRKVHSNKSVEG